MRGNNGAVSQIGGHARCRQLASRARPHQLLDCGGVALAFLAARFLRAEVIGNVLLKTSGGRLHPVHAKRSEEHTSELQSLMRISYAVFCLKKKKTTHETNHNA